MFRWNWCDALLAVCVVAWTLPCSAQQMDDMDMPGMQMPAPAHPGRMTMRAHDLIEAERNHTSSGTSIEPASSSAPMWMSMRGRWMLMLHGTAFLSEQQQSAVQRGGDKFFSTNWAMPMAMRDWGRQRLTFRAMFSLEPATVGGRRYPELFQQGETAFGRPIVDGQHPHNFLMELGALYDARVGEHGLLSLYAAPVGDPALGPASYPHRESASEDPLAALGHHQQDSTHIAFNVLTAGATWHGVRVEASGFHGAEPDEHRWGFQPSPNGLAIDSYSGRLTVSPTEDWSGQYSFGRLASPEALAPGEDQQRQTASLMYHHRPDEHHEIAATAIWGRTKSLSDDNKQNSYLLEILGRWGRRNSAWTRIENAGRSNELLLAPGSTPPPNFQEKPLGHVAAYSIGYDRQYRIAPHLLAAPGAQLSFYQSPNALLTVYGRHPFGGVIFIRLRIGE